MDTLRTRARILAVVMAASAMTADGRAADEPSPAPKEAPRPSAEATGPERPEPPAPPRKYLEAGAHLFNAGRRDLAATYLKAAYMYRDRLTPSERIVLDVYREQLGRPVGEEKGPEPPEPPAPRPDVADHPSDPAVQAASTTSVDPVKALSRNPGQFEAAVFESIGVSTAAPEASKGADPLPVVPAPGTSAEAPSPLAAAARRDTTDDKQKARWFLQLAREQIRKRNFDMAAQAIAEARGLDVKWSLFDETPDRVAAALEKARATPGDPAADDPNAPRDKKTARARLRAARVAIEAEDLDRADAIIRDVRSWGLSYNLFEDSPGRVAAAIDDARRRHAIRGAELSVKTYYRPETPAAGAPASGKPATTAPPAR